MVIVTARVAAENRIESFCVGADDYVPKPYTPDQIFQALTDASSWRGRVAGCSIEGVIPIDPGCEDDSLRLLGQLRNLLVARTTLEAETINRIHSALKEIWRDGLDWRHRSHHPLDASIGFHIQPDVLSITLRDASGWLAENRFSPAERWPEAFEASEFDDVIEEEAGHRMTFRKRYAPAIPA